ncbi:sensor histidine kinase [Glycomyces sp. NRRL B-16210]|uniref:sensor histidine kinase n=1 Tax=Glycomyces sp. NRRL B-16210 TaxID=1463821 RepID=UPI00068B1A0C|nr:histidine kinase [Glycomyces sp. NRRL B-16210]
MNTPIDRTASAERTSPAPTPGERLDGLLSRLGAGGPFARDCVFALVAAVLTFALFGAMAKLVPTEPTLELSADAAWAVTGIATGQALLLCLRRVRPVWGFAGVTALQAVIVLVAPPVMANGFAPPIAAYTLGTLAAVRFTIGAMAAAVAATALAAAAGTWGQDGALTTVGNHVVASALLYATAAFIGVHVAARRRGAALASERAAEAIRAQRRRAEAAITAERTRLARELHDVAAHHLSGMVIQAAAVERLIDRDTAAAKSGAAWIRSQGKETLANLRQVVGLLRERDGEDGGAPVPGLSALDALIEESRRLGDDVVFEREGETLVLPPIADISMYRIAQQALTNARQHAPGAPVAVRLAYGGHRVVLEVANGASTRGALAEIGSGGTGLIGMRERADLVGATFEAGPVEAGPEGGGWRVLVRLPVRDADRERPKGADDENGDAA